MSLLKCPACGTFLPLKWPFNSMICRNCGQPLAATPTPPVVEPPLERAVLSQEGRAVSEPSAYSIPTLLISYYPVRGERIDRGVTGDVDVPLDKIRRHVQQATNRVVEALEQGSVYHGYKDPTARPSLQYEIVDTLEFLEPLPTVRKAGHQVPMTDYNEIMRRIDIQEWVEERGIKEVWLWGYHGGVIDLWESNMAGPF